MAELACFLAGVACSSTSELGALVPPTADRDPALPRVAVAVGGHERWLHLDTAGDPNHPALFFLPGGPGGDFRIFAPLRALSDDYFLVLWDQHGGGLSERVSSSDELDLDGFDEEIAAVQELFAPAQRVGIIGHSFGADLALRYAARHPAAVRQLVLVEPGGFTSEAREHRPGGFVSLGVFESFFWDNEVLTSQNHEQADYRLLGALRQGTQGYYCSGQAAQEFPIWRFGAYAFEMLPRAQGDLDYSRGFDASAAPVLLLAGSCGELGASYQRDFNLPVLPGADFVSIEGAGHISLFLGFAPQTVAAIRGFLDAHP